MGAGLVVFLAGYARRAVAICRAWSRTCAEARSEAGVRLLNEQAPALLARAGGALPPEAAAILVWRYDLVPDELRDRLTWHPTEQLRELAARSRVKE